MQALLRQITEALVDDAEAIRIKEIDSGNTAIIELRVAKSDLGKVIGKKGQTAKAIRTIVCAGAAKLRKRVIVEIIDDAKM